MEDLFTKWQLAAETTVGFFWMAFWAFSLGYLISSMIQVFVTEKRMQKTLDQNESKSVVLGTIMGFVSSSCSFSALATTKSLFKKGASFLASIAFLLASTNLVIELGIIISIFLGWQFVVGEYLGGIILILVSWILIRLLKPNKLIKQAREHLEQQGSDDDELPEGDWTERITSSKQWAKVGRQYVMEWKMVWKDVTIGFTVAGIVSAFVPDEFFQILFIGSGTGHTHYTFLQLLQHVLAGPIAAFMTFIGSMGNIPLAALLFGKGVSFAGVMAFIFSDLVVFPVLRINAKYYGWKMSLFILFLLFSSLIAASLILHFGFEYWGALPDPSSVKIRGMEFFAFDYTFYLNLSFLVISAILVWLGYVAYRKMHYMKEMAPKSQLLEKTLRYLAYVCYAWLIIGWII